MTRTATRLSIAFSLCLVTAGCSDQDRADVRPAPARRPVPATAASNNQGGSRGGARVASVRVERPGRSSTPVSRYDITVDQIREHVRNRTAVIIDAREPGDYSRGHVRGAINLPADEKESYLPKFSQDVATNQLIIIYCSGSLCPASDKVYDYATSQGFTNMRVFKPGWGKLSSESDLQ